MGQHFKNFICASYLSFCASFTNDLPTSMRVDTGDSTGPSISVDRPQWWSYFQQKKPRILFCNYGMLSECSLCFDGGSRRQMADGSRHVVVNVLNTIWQLHIIRHVIVHPVWKPERRGRWTFCRCPSRTTPAPPWSAWTAPPATAPSPPHPCLAFCIFV